MFEDSLVESAGRIKTKRGWTTLFSVSLQFLFIGILVLVPLIYTQALPTAMITTFLVAPPPPPPPPPPAAVVKVTKIETELENGELRTPTKIPQKIKMIKEEEAPPPSAGVIGGVTGGVPGGSLSGVLGGIIGNTGVAPKMATPQRVRVSAGVEAGSCISGCSCPYPSMAKTARIQGAVTLHAIVDKEGRIEGLQAMSGPALLEGQAVQCVQQRRYKPYYLNGEPVEVDTTITVNYELTGE